MRGAVLRLRPHVVGQPIQALIQLGSLRGTGHGWVVVFGETNSREVFGLGRNGPFSPNLSLGHVKQGNLAGVQIGKEKMRGEGAFGACLRRIRDSAKGFSLVPHAKPHTHRSQYPMITLTPTNMEPDRGSLQEENDLPGTLPQLLC